MAQVKLLKIDSDGVPVEFNSAADDITLNSFTVQGGGPVLSGTGLDMNNKDITEVQDISFQAPSTATINQTAGNLIVDDIMAKERNNVMTSAGAILFPSIVGATAGQVDSFKLPHSTLAPSVTPAFSSDAGYLMSGAGKLYFWNGSSWDDYSTSLEAQQVANIFPAAGSLADRVCVYIDSSGNIEETDISVLASSQAVGFTKNSAATVGDPVSVASVGVLDGFTSLTPGARYYCDVINGQISSSIPTGSGLTIIQAGYAKSATELMVMIQQLGRRA